LNISAASWVVVVVVVVDDVAILSFIIIRIMLVKLERADCKGD